MDIRISANYESLINNLLSLQVQPYSKQEVDFLNQCIEYIERVAIIRSDINHFYSLPKKEIERLNQSEAKFFKNIYPLITYSKIINTYKQLDSLPRFFVAISCFSALASIALVMSALLTSSLAPLTSLLLVFTLMTSLIIFQSSLSNLSKSPVLSYLEDKILALIGLLKKVTIELDQDIRLLESKVNCRELNNPKFEPPCENSFSPSTPCEYQQTGPSSNFFKPKKLNNDNISTTIYPKAYKSFLNIHSLG